MTLAHVTVTAMIPRYGIPIYVACRLLEVACIIIEAS